MLKFISLILTLSLIHYSYFFYNGYIAYSQNTDKNATNVNSHSWVSKSNNLNITMDLDPKIPIIDQQTKISFQIKNFNGSK